MFELEKLTRKKVLAQAVAVALGVIPLIPGCGGGGGGGGGGSVAPFSAVGGAAKSGTGGRGGFVNLNATGDIEILRNGTASITFDATPPTPAFGANKLTVSSNMTVGGSWGTQGTYVYYIETNQLRLSSTGAEAPLGTLYASGNHIYSYGGNTSTDVAFTGIEVASGATLTFDGRYPYVLSLSNDFYNRGTITATDSTTGEARGTFYVTAANYFGATGSRVTTAGTATTPNGGGIDLWATAGIYNAGIIDASGFGTDTVGGDGGDAVLAAYGGPVANSGAVDVRGGAGRGGAGGSGGSITFYGHDVANSGAITADGGDAGSGSGGSAGDVSISAACTYTDGYGGTVYNHAVLHAVGGHGGGTGDGGRGGTLSVCDAGGQLALAGDMELDGGDGAGSGMGGYGGALTLEGRADTFISSLPFQGMMISGHIHLNGGGTASGTAGDAGSLRANAIGAGISMLGYSHLDMHGGSGVAAQSPGASNVTAAGALTNEANISLNSGAESGSIRNAFGGSITMAGATLNNSGDIDASGSFAGGRIDMSGSTAVTTSGNLTARGVDNPAAGGVAGGGGFISGSAIQVTVSGRINADGGKATGAGGTGGDGGIVRYSSSEPATDYAHATFSANGGSGATAGLTGSVCVDAITIAGSCMK